MGLGMALERMSHHSGNVLSPWRFGLMIVVVMSTIVAMVSTMVAMIRMVTVFKMTSASPISAISPASRENTPGGGEQGDDAYYIKNRFHVRILP